MRKHLWGFLARQIVQRDWLVNLIIRTAQRTPYFHLPDYMDRWWLMPRWCLQTDKRGNLFPKPWVPFSIRIHYIRRADLGRDLHDHPADYRTVILKGYYLEYIQGCGFHQRFTGHTVAARAETYHRISKISAGGVWTLFILGRRRNHWGFWVTDDDGKNGRKIPWEQYDNV
jgi:hypothetical protein